MKYRIEGIPPSNNKFIGRNQRWEYQDVKSQWAAIIQYLCVPKPPKPFKHSVVSIKYYFKDKRRRDPDNYSGKFILDGLVSSGIIEDDSFNNIKLMLSAEFGCGKEYTEIEVTEIVNPTKEMALR